jgi:hypothetical protein
MAVHHIDMQHRCAAAFYGTYAFTQAGKVRSEDRWSNFNGISHNFSADILSDSLFWLHPAKKQILSEFRRVFNNLV